MVVTPDSISEAVFYHSLTSWILAINWDIQSQIMHKIMILHWKLYQHVYLRKEFTMMYCHIDYTVLVISLTLWSKHYCSGPKAQQMIPQPYLRQIVTMEQLPNFIILFIISE